MLIRANACVFHAAAVFAAAAIERRTTERVLTGIKLAAQDGRLTLTATDLDMEVNLDLDVEVEGSGVAVVDGHRLRRLLDAIRKADAGAVVSLTADAEGAVLSWGDGAGSNSTARLVDLGAEDFPSLAHKPTAEHQMPAGHLLDLLARVAPCVSTEETRYYLNGVYLHARAGRLAAAATDGHRLAVTSAPRPVAAGWPALILPSKAVGWITKALRRLDPEVEVTLAASDTKLALTWPGVRLVAKAIDGTFPDYGQVIPAGGMSCTVERAALLRALRLLAAFSERGGRHYVRLDIGENRVTLTASDHDEGNISTSIPTDYAGPKIVRAFQREYLQGMAMMLRSPFLTISGEDQSAPHRIESAADPDFLSILMPCRV
ncbi:DNA polymerase III subunit beta [Phaeospirillum tilakii]|uniref:Beta sliding clamp n=1 Tax=Phaeospirillum tilakii TaxID=741673 RepID=A0ABW5CDA3_9PROT